MSRSEEGSVPMFGLLVSASGCGVRALGLAEGFAVADAGTRRRQGWTNRPGRSR
ncbi:MAG: hypothetical protein HZY73_06410 [Micropruina sp.]|nr:MAG: hypothetical protein HZY73_06410 [Micropruina sp.]